MKINMNTFFIVVGLIAGILGLISVAGYRYYNSKSGEQRHKESKEHRDVIERKVDEIRDAEDSYTDLTSLFEFELLNDNTPSYAILTPMIKNTSEITAESALMLLQIEYPPRVLNGGYTSGQRFFKNNQAQLHVDTIHANTIASFDGVKVMDFEKMCLSATLVAKNMPKKTEKIYIIKEDGELKINQIDSKSPTWVNDLIGQE